MSARVCPTRWTRHQGQALDAGSVHGCYVVLRPASSLGSGLRYWVRCPHGNELVKTASDLRKAPSSCRACTEARR